jgi:phosphatidylserine/phosphatidylglycerophosphate/cardiolipin synthase-like enzyme
MKKNDGPQIIAREAGVLAKTLPYQIVQHLSDCITGFGFPTGTISKTKIVQGISPAHYRSLAVRFLDTWQSQAPDVTAQAVALSLITAAECEKIHREDQSVELVWTGPNDGCLPLRQTEQVLLQIVESASKRIVVVSYAVYNIPRICEALVKAAERGVIIKIIIETPDRLEGENTYNTLKALGPAVAKTSTVFFWPADQRDRDASGRHGILHVKCAVADSRWLFLSSANLTEYAFTLNMELGLFITGGALPEQVEGHFNRMIQTGVLIKV